MIYKAKPIYGRSGWYFNIYAKYTDLSVEDKLLASKLYPSEIDIPESFNFEIVRDFYLIGYKTDEGIDLQCRLPVVKIIEENHIFNGWWMSIPSLPDKSNQDDFAFGVGVSLFKNRPFTAMSEEQLLNEVNKLSPISGWIQLKDYC